MVGTVIMSGNIAVNKTYGAYIPVGIFIISHASWLLKNISALKKYFLAERQNKPKFRVVSWYT